MDVDFVETDGATAVMDPKANRLGPELKVASLLDLAIRMGASDLYISCNETCVEVSARHLGIVRRLTLLPTELGTRCMAHIRAAAGVRIDEKRKPQDGRWVRRYGGGKMIDLRLATMPTLYGDSFAIRILVRDSCLHQLDALGLVGPQLDILRGWLQSPHGLVLVTGSTGAGKTTTLYACLQHLNDGRRKIHTIEDPIEYALEGLRQSQVDDINGPDFRQLLRGVLRQGPDVVMIGEVRDQMAAETAVRAANSGHLVFASLHAPMAADAVQSMLSLGAHPHFLCSSLLGVIGQRLVRTLCPKSKVPLDLSHAPRTFEEVQPWLEGDQGKVVYAAARDVNGNEGYAGRTGVFELLCPTPAVRRLIAASRPAAEIGHQAVEDGMLDFRRVSLLKVAQGLTSFDEILRVVPSEDRWDGM